MTGIIKQTKEWKLSGLAADSTGRDENSAVEVIRDISQDLSMRIPRASNPAKPDRLRLRNNADHLHFEDLSVQGIQKNHRFQVRFNFNFDNAMEILYF